MKEILGFCDIGDIVVSLKYNSGNREEGDMFKVLGCSTKLDLYYKWHTCSSYKAEWRLATQSEIDAFNQGVKNIKNIKVEENILEQAKKRYPIGTKFYPAHVKEAKQNNEFCIVTSDEFKSDSYSYICAVSNKGNQWEDSYDSENGNISYNRNVYYNGKWAEILVDDKQEDPTPFDMGNWCIKVTKENKQELRKDSHNTFKNPWSFTIGSYYGFRNKFGYYQTGLPFGTELSIELFRKYISMKTEPIMKHNLYGHTEVNEECDECDGSGETKDASDALVQGIKIWSNKTLKTNKYYMGIDSVHPLIQIKNRNKPTQQLIQKRVKLNIKQINQIIKIKHYV